MYIPLKNYSKKNYIFKVVIVLVFIYQKEKRFNTQSYYTKLSSNFENCFFSLVFVIEFSAAGREQKKKK